MTPDKHLLPATRSNITSIYPAVSIEQHQNYLTEFYTLMRNTQQVGQMLTRKLLTIYRKEMR